MRMRCIVIGLILIALLAATMSGTALAVWPFTKATPTVAPAAMPTMMPTAMPTPTMVPGGSGMTLPPGMTLGDYGKVIPASKTPAAMPGTFGKLAPNVPGGPGMTTPAGTTLGPYGAVVPVSQAPTVVARVVPGQQGITLPKGMTLGPYSKIIPAGETIPKI